MQSLYDVCSGIILTPIAFSEFQVSPFNGTKQELSCYSFGVNFVFPRNLCYVVSDYIHGDIAYICLGDNLSGSLEIHSKGTQRYWSEGMKDKVEKMLFNHFNLRAKNKRDDKKDFLHQMITIQDYTHRKKLYAVLDEIIAENIQKEKHMGAEYFAYGTVAGYKNQFCPEFDNDVFRDIFALGFRFGQLVDDSQEKSNLLIESVGEVYRYVSEYFLGEDLGRDILRAVINHLI
jgi:hypothetical protein